MAATSGAIFFKLNKIYLLDMHVGRKKADMCEKQGFSPEFALGDMYVHIIPISNSFGAGTKFIADRVSVCFAHKNGDFGVTSILCYAVKLRLADL